MKSVIYPGTFDPITNGHQDIIQRAARLFSQVVVAVAANPSKRPLLSLEERTALIQDSVCRLPNVRVVGFSDLLAGYVCRHNIDAIIRGVRSTTDFDYELSLAQLNRQLGNNIETVFFPSHEKWGYISSTMIREIYLHGGDIAPFVPPAVVDLLESKKQTLIPSFRV